MQPPFITGLFTLTGVLIGASLAFFVGVWKSVTDFRVSCRLVKNELQRNANILLAAADDLRCESFRGVSDDVWRTCQVNLALLVPEREWDLLTGHYAMMPILRAELDRAGTLNLTEEAALEKSIRQLVDEIGIYKAIVGEFESRSRLKLFVHALRGRTARAKATQRTG